jgi:hypothetical protein
MSSNKSARTGSTALIAVLPLLFVLSLPRDMRLFTSLL